MPRTFVAIRLPDPPEPHREQLAAHIEACRAIAPELRWVRSEGLHVTLRFVGNTGTATVERLRDQLTRLAFSPFRIRLGGMGTFGGRAASVLWIAIAEGVPPLERLAAACEEAARAAGADPEGRPFRPHLTLARAGRARLPIPDLPPPPELPPWTVDEFVLFDSALGPGGARYSVVEAYPAQPRPPATLRDSAPPP